MAPHRLISTSPRKWCAYGSYSCGVLGLEMRNYRLVRALLHPVVGIIQEGTTRISINLVAPSPYVVWTRFESLSRTTSEQQHPQSDTLSQSSARSSKNGGPSGRMPTHASIVVIVRIVTEQGGGKGAESKFGRRDPAITSAVLLCGGISV